MLASLLLTSPSNMPSLRTTRLDNLLVAPTCIPLEGKMPFQMDPLLHKAVAPTSLVPTKKRRMPTKIEENNMIKMSI